MMKVIKKFSTSIEDSNDLGDNLELLKISSISGDNEKILLQFGTTITIIDIKVLEEALDEMKKYLNGGILK